MKKVKLSICGGVATKAAFDLFKKEENLEIYDITSVQYENSIVSIMADKVDIDIEKTEKTDSWTMKVIYDDLKKDYIEKLKNDKPDYIVLDLVSDGIYGCLKVGNSYITNNKPKLKKVKVNSYTEEVSVSTKGTIEYNKLVKENISKFLLLIERELPNTKVILHCAKLCHGYYGEQRRIMSFKRYDIINKNRVLLDLYSFVKEFNNVEVIDLNNKIYFSKVNHKWSPKPSPIHYEDTYYRDFIATVDRIVLKDLLIKS